MYSPFEIPLGLEEKREAKKHHDRDNILQNEIKT